MKKLVVSSFIIELLITTFFFAQSNNQLPKGWHTGGNNKSEYEMGIDKSVFQHGMSSAFLKSKDPKVNDFGTVMQYISAENYLGKRLKLSGYIKCDEVEGWSGMWMRIDGNEGQQLGFDNMQDRPIKGTTNWEKYEIVLDVPANSKGIAYGFLLSGKGKVWFDNMKMEEVDKSVSVTNLIKETSYPKEPINLDFEE
jgi:hypothetical protein